MDAKKCIIIKMVLTHRARQKYPKKFMNGIRIGIVEAISLQKD